MKQIKNKNNFRKSIEQQNVKPGPVSVVNILEKMSKQTEDTNKLLGSITGRLYKQNQYFSLSLSKQDSISKIVESGFSNIALNIDSVIQSINGLSNKLGNNNINVEVQPANVNPPVINIPEQKQSNNLQTYFDSAIVKLINKLDEFKPVVENISNINNIVNSSVNNTNNNNSNINNVSNVSNQVNNVNSINNVQNNSNVFDSSVLINVIVEQFDRLIDTIKKSNKVVDRPENIQPTKIDLGTQSSNAPPINNNISLDTDGIENYLKNIIIKLSNLQPIVNDISNINNIINNQTNNSSTNNSSVSNQLNNSLVNNRNNQTNNSSVNNSSVNNISSTTNNTSISNQSISSQKTYDNQLLMIFNVLTDIHSLIEKYIKSANIRNQNINAAQSAGLALGKLFTSFNEGATDIVDEHIVLISNNLINIEKILNQISNAVDALKSNNLSNKQNKTSNSKEKPINFEKAINEFKKTFDDKLLNNFKTFVELYQELLSETNTKKLIFVSLQMSRYGHFMLILSFTINRAKRALNGFTVALIMLSATMMTPFIHVGFSILISELKLLKTVLCDKSAIRLHYVLKQIGNSIILLAAGGLLMSQIPLGNMIKFIFVLGLLLSTLRLFTTDKNKTQVIRAPMVERKFGVSASGVFSACMGIILLVYAISFVRTIDFKAAGALLLFIGGLCTILKLFKGKTSLKSAKLGDSIFKFDNKGPLDSLLSISIGITILLLCVAAIEEIHWGASLYLLGFIFSLGLTLSITNTLTSKSKFGGNLSGMFGFAAGVAILILCADAVAEVDWLTASKLILFIAGISMAIHAPEMIMRFSGKKFGGGGGKMSGMFGFAAGLAILILCIDAASEVDFTNGFKLIVIVGALTFFTSKLGNSKTASLQLIGLAVGIAALAGGLFLLSFVKINLEDLFIDFIAINIFLILINQIVNDKKLIFESVYSIPLFVGSSVALIAILFLVSLFPINLKKIFEYAIGVSIMVFVYNIIGNNGKDITKASLIVVPFAASMILLTAGFYFSSLFHVNLLNLITLATVTMMFIGIYYIVARLENQILKASYTITAMSASLLILAFTTSLISLTYINFERLFGFVGACLIFIGISLLMYEVSKQILKSSYTMLALSGSIFVLALTVTLLSVTYINFTNILMFTLCSALIFGLMYGLSFIAASVAIGAAATLAVSLAIVILGFSLSLVSMIPYNIKNIGNFSLCFLILAGVLIVAIVAAPFMLIGAVALTAVAVTLLITAGLFFIISCISINKENLNLMISAMIDASLLIAKSTPFLLLGIVGGALLAVLAVELLVVSALFFLISEIKIDSNNINNFGNSIVLLIKQMDKFGVISAGKAALKAGLLLPVAACGLAIAILFRAISFLDINPAKMDMFGKILDMFVDNMANAVDRNREKLESNMKGFQAIALMANAAKNLVDVLQSLAELKIGIWKEDKKNGGVKLVGYEKFDPKKEGERVKNSMGLIIECLVAPLAIMSSDADMWDFGNGKQIPNPFGKAGFFGPGKTSGIERIKLIGEAFEKIPGIMQAFLNNPLLTDSSEEGMKKMQTLQSNIATFFDTMVTCMDKLPKKSFIDNWVDGVDKWMRDKVSPVMSEAVVIIKKIGSETTMFQYSKTPLILNNVNSLFKMINNVSEKIYKAQQLDFDTKKFQRTYVNLFKILIEDLLPNLQRLIEFDNIKMPVHLASTLNETINIMENIPKIESYKKQGKKLKQFFNDIDGLQKISLLTDSNVNLVVNSTSFTPFITSSLNNIERVITSNINKYRKGLAKKIVEFYDDLDTLQRNCWINSNGSDINIVAKNTQALIDAIGDNRKFSLINKNLQTTAKNIKSIVDNINKINIGKAAALEKNLRLLTQAQTQDKLREAIEELRELIGLLVIAQETQTKSTDSLTNTIKKANGIDEKSENERNKNIDNETKNMSSLEAVQRIANILQKVFATQQGAGYLRTDNLTPQQSGHSLSQSEITDAILDALDGTNDGKFSGKSIF